MGFDLDKYHYANAKRRFLGSRRVFSIIFAIFILIGVGCIIFSTNVNTQAFGISLLAGALISIATMWIDYIRTGEQIRADELLRTGLQAAYARRDLVDEYERHVKGCRYISVAGYTLTAFTESNEQYFRERMNNGNPVSVKMLLVNPDSQWAQAMECTEGKPSGAYKQAYNAILSKMGGLEGAELRLLDRPLPMMIYKIDKVLYTGPYPHQGASRMATTLKLADSGWLYDRQCEEFQSLWEKATEVSIKEIKVAISQ